MKKDLFAWRELVASKFGPSCPTTRLVLLVLSLFMNSKTMSCFPSVKTIAEATGLSKKSVCTQLRIAKNQGWISKARLGKSGQGWKLNSYRALFPDNVVTVVHHQGGVAASPPCDPKRGVIDAKRGVNQGKKSGNRSTPPENFNHPKTLGISAKRKKNVVNDVHTNQLEPLNEPDNAVNELHHVNGIADADSKKESDPLSPQKRHEPSKADWDDFKKKLRKIGGGSNTFGPVKAS